MNPSGLKCAGGRRARGSNRLRPGTLPPPVSIVTATFNAEKDLARCIESVLEQTYAHCEFIIIDGGSTDATLDIIRSLEERIDCWISEPDRGVYDALNKGIDLARGDWIYFLGADDRLADKDVLSRVFSEPPDSRLLYGDVRWGATGRLYDGAFTPTKLFRANICQQAVFYHRELFETLGGFDLGYPLWADWVFNMQAFGHRKTRPRYLDTPVADYGTQGLSAGAADEHFLRDREQIFLECFGRLALFRIKFAHFRKSLFSAASENQ